MLLVILMVWFGGMTVSNPHALWWDVVDASSRCGLCLLVVLILVDGVRSVAFPASFVT